MVFVLVGLFVFVATAKADSVSVNFENPPYTIGVINGIDGWVSLGAAGSGCAVYDHKVSSSLGTVGFAAQSLRISDAFTSGCFGDQTFAKPLIDSVGETAATAGTFSAGIRQPHFEMQFDIASTQLAQQPGMHVSVSPDRGDGSRMSYLRIEDGENGINIFFDDVQGTIPVGNVDCPVSISPPFTYVLGGFCGNFVETQIGTNLSRNVPHHVKLTFDAINGPSNDIVKVWIDGALVITGTSWEDYYRFDSEAYAEQSPRIVKTVIFRTSGVATPEDNGKGFLFDNLSLFSGPIPTTNPNKVNICHWENKKSTKYQLINVSVNAEQAHLNHGDGFPGGIVPGTNNRFMDNCGILKYIETVEIPANKNTDTTSLKPLIVGVNYILKARGMACAEENTPGVCTIFFDADYSNTPAVDGSTWVDGVTNYSVYTSDLLDLKVNGGFINWGAPSSSHEYMYPIIGGGSTVSFGIYDVYYPNNTGSLFVDIYAL